MARIVTIWVKSLDTGTSGAFIVNGILAFVPSSTQATCTRLSVDVFPFSSKNIIPENVFLAMSTGNVPVAVMLLFCPGTTGSGLTVKSYVGLGFLIWPSKVVLRDNRGAALTMESVPNKNKTNTRIRFQFILISS